MEVDAAQRDVNVAHVGGAPGVFVSGLVWLLAGFIEARHGANAGFAALFIGGMAIVPASLLITRSLFRAPRVSPGNPLERLGLESTFSLFAGLLIAYALLQAAPELAFPALAIALGGRYFVFRTIYSEPFYWALGGAIALAGTAAMLRVEPVSSGLLFAVGALEIGFAALLLARLRERRRRRS